VPLFIDPAAGRIVFQNTASPPGSPLKVIDGETAEKCRLAEGQRVTPQQAAALLDGLVGMYRSLVDPDTLAAIDAAEAVPDQTPVARRELDGVTYMGTHPRYPNSAEGLTISFSDNGLVTRIYDEPWINIPWSRITSINADSRESLESRVTATRVLLFGAIGLLAKKTTVVSYLVIGADGGEYIFAVPKLNSVALQSWSLPFRARLPQTIAQPLPAPTAPAAGPAVEDVDQIAARLERLDALRTRNLITDAEHATQRAQIIAEL
jgi:hypothetical protein